MRKKLKEARTNMGYTQKEVAEKTDITRAHYTNIELGNKDPSFRVARKIKKVLKEEDDDIFLISNVPKRNNQQSA
ncbi:MAG: helix-turn-helix transcriptional regulator [Bacteroidales bacterium]